ncbi:hypothetical protein NBRC116589_11830 [Ruegeria sp. HU-ET01832]|uniref:MipA/OmpV family protein n=1 Tax=Ruegeria sp. HU-ET01832 TaxID=3135906 RepID=UPI0031054C7C
MSAKLEGEPFKNRLLIAAVFFASSLGGSAYADGQFVGMTPSFIPSHFGLGFGSYPEHIGSEKNEIGFAPFGRYSWGKNRYIALEVNYASMNLLEHRNWRFGPAGMWRFGRKDVDDPVVNELPDIDGSLEVGFFGAFEQVGEDPRDRWWFGGNITQGITGDNNGYTITASVRRWMPIGRFSAFGLSLGTTYGSSDYMDTFFSVDTTGSDASGLPVFQARSGIRDVRVAAIFMQPVSRKWVIGGGLLYSRLLEDAANSPIVSQRGDPDQLVFGFGLARGF